LSHGDLLLLAGDADRRRASCEFVVHPCFRRRGIGRLLLSHAIMHAQSQLAERLDLPQVTFAAVIETQGDQVRIKRDGDTATEVIGATMPIVMSVTDQTGEARYPSFKGIMAAKKKPLETWSLADLGVDAELVGLNAATSAVEEASERPPRTAGEIVTDEDGSGATALTEFLASKKFI